MYFPESWKKLLPSLSELFNENEALNILSVFWIVFRSARETYNFPANLEDRRVFPRDNSAFPIDANVTRPLRWLRVTHCSKNKAAYYERGN
jgi:hypothetical protein